MKNSTLPSISRGLFFGAAFFSCVATGSLVGLAQTASQLTEPEFAPPAQRLAGSIVFSGEYGLVPPPGAEQLSIEIGQVAVEGARPEWQDLVGAFETRLTSGRIASAVIFQAASELEQALANEGYILTRVVLPQQTLRDGGTLRVAIVDGFVEQIDTENVPDPVRSRIESVTGNLLGRASLRLGELERSLLIAGDTYGVSLGSVLRAGAQPGGTVIALDPEYRQVTGFVGFDTLLSDDLGGYTIDTGVEVNGALGFGEALYGRLSGNPENFFSDRPNLRTVVGGVVLPIGSDGWTFNLEATRTDSTVSGAGADSYSRFERVSARAFYPLIRSRSENLTTQVIFDAATDTLDLDGVARIHKDETRVLRFSLDWFRLQSTGAALELGANLSFGLDALGARSAADATPVLPLSRPGADADFTKLEVSARYRAPLGNALSLTLAGRAQTSFSDPLVLSEQIGIASSSEVSGFADKSAGLDGDNGWALRAELAYDAGPIFSEMPVSAFPYLFAAAGQVSLHQPVPGERSRTSAQSYGIGVDLAYLHDDIFSSSNLRLEVARGVRDGGSDRTVFSVVANHRF